MMKILLVFLMLFNSVIITDSRADDNSNTHRFMSFNILYSFLSGTHHSWSVRKDVVLEIIEKYAPDIIGLQEADDLQLALILSTFVEYDIYGHKTQLGLTDDCSILYRTSKYERLDGGTFWLSETPERRSRGWDAVLVRNCTWAKFKVKETGDVILVYNTHFDHRGGNAKVNSAKLILDYIEKHKKQFGDVNIPVVLLGDINAGEKSPTLDVLRTVFRDTFRVIHPDAENIGTYHTKEGKVLGCKIDYVLVDHNWEVLDADIIRHPVDGVYPSDHFPVVADVRLK